MKIEYKDQAFEVEFTKYAEATSEERGIQEESVTKVLDSAIDEIILRKDGESFMISSPEEEIVVCGYKEEQKIIIELVSRIDSFTIVEI